jgi:hypothetical protein
VQVKHQLASKTPSRASSLGQGKVKKFADDDNVDDDVDDAEEEDDDEEEPQTDGGDDGGEYVDEEEVEIAIASGTPADPATKRCSPLPPVTFFSDPGSFPNLPLAVVLANARRYSIFISGRFA